MKNKNFTTTLLVDQTPKEVFDSIRNVRGWWSGYYSEEIKGDTEKLNDEFSFRAGDGVHYSKQKLVEVIPNKKVVWLTLENNFNFTHDQSEWIGTKPIFEISEKDSKTEIRFTHEGLVPGHECYNICHDAWSFYIQKSLHNLIMTGKGEPNERED